MGELTEEMVDDHARLEALLGRADGGGAIDRTAYAEFRAGLLRHMAIEDKVLAPRLKQKLGHMPELARRMRIDHAAIASLLVPSPRADVIATLRRLLSRHNRLEEGPGGFYALCEQELAADLDAVLSACRAVPAVAEAPHKDGAHVDDVVAARVRDADAAWAAHETPA